jgi:nucleoside-diphosphate-sugar epimerase
MTEERFFITGGQGFIGAWIARQLLAERASFVLFDLARDDHILGQVLEPEELERLERLDGDVADGRALQDAVARSGATAVIHLAGLQIPACRQDPARGALVNVAGTVNVLEAARRLKGKIGKVVYASSAAVAGAPEDYAGPIEDAEPHRSRTHYGVFKTANEGNARVFWLDHELPSVGLRPLSVYGPGREIGITSGPTKAIKAAVLGRRFTIPFTGSTALEFVPDLARIFIACARARVEGALALNVAGTKASVEGFIRALEEALPEARGKIDCAGPALPVACDFQETGLSRLLGPVARTPLAEGVRQTARHFRRLLERGRLDDRDLSA